MDLSVIVVSDNTRAMTLECLESIYRETTSIAFEVLVVDNASSDGSAAAIRERFPEVRLLALDENQGFARANNLAALETRGRFLLLLNPDTVILDRAIEKLFRFAIEDRGLSIWGGRTLFADGSLNPSCAWARPSLWSLACGSIGLTALFPHSSLFHPEAMPAWDRTTLRRVDIVTGCFLLIAKALWDRLGGFDPEFFMYAEEADLCLRAGKLGFECWIYPEATIVHHGGASEPVRGDKTVRLLAGRCRLLAKHWSAPAAWIGKCLFSSGIGLRLVASGLARCFSRRYEAGHATWRQVWRERAAWLSPPPLRKLQASRPTECETSFEPRLSPRAGSLPPCGPRS